MTRRYFVQGAMLAFAVAAIGERWTFARENKAEATSHVAFEWGLPLPNGLQIGAQADMRSGRESSLVNCLIRNQGKMDAQYNDYFLGNWEKIEVWARPLGTASWVKLERDPASLRLMLGVGPGSRHYTLKPGEKLIWRSKAKAKGNETHYTTNFMPYAMASATPASTKNVQFMPYTFAVGLHDFIFPATWKGPVELQVVHTLLANGKLTNKKNEQFKLTYQPVRSGSVMISANMVRVLQMPRDRVLHRGYITPAKTTE